MYSLKILWQDIQSFLLPSSSFHLSPFSVVSLIPPTQRRIPEGHLWRDYRSYTCQGVRLIKPNETQNLWGFSAWRSEPCSEFCSLFSFLKWTAVFSSKAPFWAGMSLFLFLKLINNFGGSGSSLPCRGCSPVACGLQQMWLSGLAALQHVLPSWSGLNLCPLHFSLLLRLVFTPMTDCTPGTAVSVSSPVFSG